MDTRIMNPVTLYIDTSLQKRRRPEGTELGISSFCDTRTSTTTYRRHIRHPGAPLIILH